MSDIIVEFTLGLCYNVAITQCTATNIGYESLRNYLRGSHLPFPDKPGNYTFKGKIVTVEGFVNHLEGRFYG